MLPSSNDPYRFQAQAELKRFFEEHHNEVFYSRQIEVLFEDKFYHWITNRALRDLIEQNEVETEVRKLSYGASIHLVWNKKYRYYKRSATKVVSLVERYSDPRITEAVGLHGQAMVAMGLARAEFVMKGENTQKFKDKEWTKTGHDLDFIFERDGIAYGIEVKNKLGYMEKDEIEIKIDICKYLNLVPLFVVRMLPKDWINTIIQEGGFVLILKYQLYPWSEKELADKVRKELNLPVDSPRALQKGTIQRFVNWHIKHIKNKHIKNKHIKNVI